MGFFVYGIRSSFAIRKIELWVKEEDKDQRNEIWRTIRDYEHMVFKSATDELVEALKRIR